MKIIYITLSDPRLKESGIYPDLINALKERGHEITVCFADSPGNIDHTLCEEVNGIKLLRVLVGENFNVGLIKKGINTLKMEPLLKAAIKKYLKNEEFDLCLYATPPVTFAGVIAYCKKKYKLKTFLMLKDIFPQNAVDIGLFKEGSLIHRYFRKKEEKLYLLSDKIGCMSKGNLEYIKKHDPFVDEDKLMVFPNTIRVRNQEAGHKESDPDTKRNIEIRASEDIRDYEEPGTSKDFGGKERGKKVSFIFGGNLGKPQGLDFLLEAISDERLTKRDDIEFMIIGKGSESKRVEERAAELPNLVYRSHLPVHEYNEVMKACDVGIISLDVRFTIPNYPSRVLGYMEMKKPVLACTDRNTDMRELVESEGAFGLWCASDDKESFVKNVLKLADDEKLRIEMGERGYRYLCGNFTVERSVRAIEEAFESL